MRQEQALGVFGISHAVVEEVPVQSVCACVGVAGCTAMPMLEAHRRIVKEHFAFSEEEGRAAQL